MPILTRNRYGKVVAVLGSYPPPGMGGETHRKLWLASNWWPWVYKKGPMSPHLRTQCWTWQGTTDEHGYGRARRKYKSEMSAHRIAFTCFKGPVPDGQMVRHRCDNPSCVNPAHLVAGSGKDNCDDMVRHGSKCVLYRRDSEGE